MKKVVLFVFQHKQCGTVCKGLSTFYVNDFIKLRRTLQNWSTLINNSCLSRCKAKATHWTFIQQSNSFSLQHVYIKSSRVIQGSGTYSITLNFNKISEINVLAFIYSLSSFFRILVGNNRSFFDFKRRFPCAQF